MEEPLPAEGRIAVIAIIIVKELHQFHKVSLVLTLFACINDSCHTEDKIFMCTPLSVSLMFEILELYRVPGK